jgi:hypothetical protein
MMDDIVVDDIEKDNMLKRLDYLLEMTYAEFTFEIFQRRGYRKYFSYTNK